MNKCKKVRKLIHYKFNNKQILHEALTHSSFIKTNINSNYQRLEFLGNSVLGSVLADIIFIHIQLQMKDYYQSFIQRWQVQMV